MTSYMVHGITMTDQKVEYPSNMLLDNDSTV